MDNVKTEFIKTEQELIKYRNELGYKFTLDDFIEEYRIGKTNAKKYLSEVNSIKLIRSLFLKMKKKYPHKIKHVKYYNENEIFLTLLDKGIIQFQYRYGDSMKVSNIPNKFVKEHLSFFKEDCLKFSATPSEVSKRFLDKPKQYERAVNNELTSIVSIIGGTARYHVLLDNQIKLDHIISWNIINAIKECK